MAVKTQQFLLYSNTSGIHVSTPSSHHQPLQWTDPRLSTSKCTLGYLSPCDRWCNIRFISQLLLR